MTMSRDLEKFFTELQNKIFSIDSFLAMGENIFYTILIIAGCKVLKKYGEPLIETVLIRKNSINNGRAQTLCSILKSVFHYLISFAGAILVLNIFAPDITKPILASAGIMGLAISFGSQNLVKDVITGFFILFEDQFAVSDYITTCNQSGYVEELGLRVTKLRDTTGELHIIPNGLIAQVTNHSRGSMLALVDVGIAYEADIDKALDLLHQLVEDTARELDYVMEGPTVLGVQDLGFSRVIIRIIAKTKPMQQWELERNLRKKIKQLFDANGIEIPYPKQVLVDQS